MDGNRYKQKSEDLPLGRGLYCSIQSLVILFNRSTLWGQSEKNHRLGEGGNHVLQLIDKGMQSGWDFTLPLFKNGVIALFHRRIVDLKIEELPLTTSPTSFKGMGIQTLLYKERRQFSSRYTPMSNQKVKSKVPSSIINNTVSTPRRLYVPWDQEKAILPASLGKSTADFGSCSCQQSLLLR